MLPYTSASYDVSDGLRRSKQQFPVFLFRVSKHGYVEVNNNAMLYLKSTAATHFLTENVIKLDYFRVLELEIRGGIKDGKKPGYIYIYREREREGERAMREGNV